MLSMRELSRVYRTDMVETTALDGIFLDVADGEFVAVMGPSGCGKSTLLNVVGMLDSPSSGSYVFDGTEVAGLPAGSILPAAPPYDPAADRGVSDAVHKAATPTTEEAALATTWVDAAATPEALKTACDAAAASDPKKNEDSTDLATFVAHTRASDTWFHCNNLLQYTSVLKLDGLAPAGHDAKVCELATFKHDVDPPASMKDAYAAVATKRCGP